MSRDNIKLDENNSQDNMKKSCYTLTKEEAFKQGLELMDDQNFCLLGTIGDNGFPNIKGMNNLRHDGMKRIWFSTNTSSKRVQQLKKDNKACVYYVNAKKFKGLMLIGRMEILQDIDTRKMLWSEEAEIYYPLGLDDPDYSVLCFTADWGNLYHNMNNISFEIE
jgi:general stress protein 26